MFFILAFCLEYLFWNFRPDNRGDGIQFDEHFFIRVGEKPPTRQTSAEIWVGWLKIVWTLSPMVLDWNWKGIVWSWVWSTPPKFNMEPENGGETKRNFLFWGLRTSGSMLNFGGVKSRICWNISWLGHFFGCWIYETKTQPNRQHLSWCAMCRIYHRLDWEKIQTKANHDLWWHTFFSGVCV